MRCAKNIIHDSKNDKIQYNDAKKKAPETRYPYPASLQYNSQHFCGGALVAPNIVVTAAHCTTTATITGVVLGRYDLDSMTDYDYETMAVIGVVLHPGWDPIIVSNDVALLILERDSRHPYVTINRDQDVPTQGEHLVVMGWGDIDQDSIKQQTSDKLRETDVIYLSNDVCDMSQGYANTPQGYQFLTYEDLIGDNMLCAFGGLSATVSDACQGDSGGPLVKTGSVSAADVLVGLVSWGFSCADSNFPGVYSRMSAFFVDFLRPEICEYSSSPPAYLECFGSDAGGLVVPTPSPVLTDSAYDEFIPTPIPASTNLVYDELTPSPSPVLTHTVFAETAPVDSTWQPTDSQSLAGDPPIYNQPAPSPVQISSPDTSLPAHNGEDYAFTFTPVTGSITCKRGGMACTITCSNCASIKRVALGMNMEWPNESTIIYTTQRGTDEYPDDPSLLIVVGTETTSANEISCDVGCTCSSVNDSVLGCGLVSHSNLEPALAIPDALNCSVHIAMSRCLMTCMLVLLYNLT
ncbi:hypothetical protein ACHAW5_010377 [Stephanodiscus triporus]|uniref:Peptidase S1 domain-containing protein n=1 Tax=Stephanodiscus triporus TaxID=2934178 RepID=A0ABD3P2Q8_9STRA